MAKKTTKQTLIEIRNLKKQAKNPDGSKFKYNIKHPSWIKAEKLYKELLSKFEL